jgi:glycosyltransferase involved in cell wall biosynthesis
VVVVTEAFRENLIRRGIPPDKIEIIRNGVDLSHFVPRPVPIELARELGAEGKFVVSYIGTIGMAHAVENILSLADIMRANKEILFLIVGEGAEKTRIQRIAARNKLENIKVLPGVAKKNVPDYYALSRLNIVTLRKAPAFTEVIPSKIFEIMAMARPILCAVDGECRYIIEKAGSGIAVEPENTAQMQKAILALRENPEEIKRLGERGRQFVEQHFNREDLAAQYLSHLQKLAPGSLNRAPETVHSLEPDTR